MTGSATNIEEQWSDNPVRIIGFLAGLALTSFSLSSGFIWVCGARCVDASVVWTTNRRVPLAFLAAFAAWWGYLVAHRAVTGQFVDPGNPDKGGDEGIAPAGPRSLRERAVAAVGGLVPPGRTRLAGFVLGIAMLVSGIVVGFVYIRQGNHLLTNVGGALFLGGYVVAHYAETGTPL